ncbi:ABC transporter ATP-binding protein [Acidocella aromatica]|uniref:Putative hydroxymethylpyrimidine transport system ATP-binding protein n=1 Tax=Acidocella aromatica TaxID=1303579 RepID=A0A840VIK1_9PROT|nr:ABC transporter ATP-binding protein [Acidocella aromatica]MBB5372109.1 putative hydroxymethylpyrimidine transport system ATP-binding protein [Acidocella aromatica]
MPPPGIVIEGLCLRYAGESIFENLSVTLPGGRFSALLGPSGVGKTSLLRIIAGLEAPAAGRVYAEDNAPLAGRVAYMAQQDLLLPWASALNNVMLGATLRGEARDPQRAEALLHRVGLGHRLRALPATLSGGERQRVALARTLYEERPVVLMDEPFSALDAISRARIQELAAELLDQRTVLLITHDPLEACRLGHSLWVLAGNPATLGSPLTVPGAPPRAPDNNSVLHMQGELLRRLAALSPA